MSDPIPFGVPFMPPRRRALTDEFQNRLLAWCDELVPGVTVDIEEWVGADPRQPLHAVVLSFPQDVRSSIVLRLKVDELARSMLAEALET